MKISVLDQAPVSEGVSSAQALRNVLELAQLADRLGFYRYWVAEHHGSTSLACASPEVLIGPIAAATQRLRVGSGGVMLPHYSALKVAESFGMLSGLYPGRIDLGLGRAPGSDSLTASALQRDRRQRPPDDFFEQLNELLAYQWDRVPAEHPYARLADLPGRPESPQTWLLGSSPQSGIWAAELGLPYMFADFIQAAGEPVCAAYHRDFVASDALAAPHSGVAVQVICADTDEEARLLASSYAMRLIHMHTGRRLDKIPSVDTALRFFEQHQLPIDSLPPGRRAIVGSPHRVREEIEAVAAAYGASEVMAVSIIYDHQARMRSYELLAQAFELQVAA
ncbi:LLM class flavin-dependent oxidoreductase [Herbaspirillum sp. LeCh32-8]|uniref:LLM class flavin-dependent oxidoreductase n=1 Tax=Herbaspirillum sp. LeCh32-8 TaxID=2821356 RepID=UPI001AE939B2|nr:LLM class flavin-dependent oxidoreductase [Herbaspirillum sp. LeCh32-8]MBP0596925.1 LLM class flavin-dependent oxidoreductase [Herbaspirillum sp. LeCh32-8]